MKKISAIILTLSIAFMFSGIFAEAVTGQNDSVSAEDSYVLPDNIASPSETDDPVTPSDTNEPVTPTDPYDPYEYENTAEYAEMYLVSYWNVASPHVFIYFYNLTNHPITVGAYTCPEGQGVSIGSLGVSTADGDGTGVYYNMELYRIGQTGTFPMVVSLRKVISKADLDAVTEFILTHNTWEFFLFNCSWFAAKCWNVGGGEYLVPITLFPSILRLQMLFHEHGGAIELYKATRDQVMRQLGEGPTATVKIASDKSME